MTQLQCINSIKTRSRSQSVKAIEAGATLWEQDPIFRRPNSKKTDKVYEIEIAEENGPRVKVHYKGYSADYDEWKMRDEVIVSASPTLDRPDFHPITELACLIKKRLLPSRHQDSAVSVLVPSTKDGFADLQARGKPGRLKGQFGISGYSDLNDLFGEGWHYRITNRIGDFSYVIPDTVAFWETKPHPLKEYRAVKNRDGSITFEPLFIEQSSNIVFKFVRGDGNKAKLLEFI